MVDWFEKKNKENNLSIIANCFTIENVSADKTYKNQPYKYLMEIIHSNLNEYAKSNKYYGPFTTLVQSSGTGKSRACFDLAREMFVLYICLRPKNSPGYPSASIHKNYLIESSMT